MLIEMPKQCPNCPSDEDQQIADLGRELETARAVHEQCGNKILDLQRQLAEAQDKLKAYRTLKWECAGCENRDGQIATITEERDALREGLAKLETVCSPYVDAAYCPACKLSRLYKPTVHQPHTPDCWLAKLLNEENR